MIEHPVINRDPEIMGGTPVFMGTRVPIVTLLDYLRGGHPLDEFLDEFPTVRREQAVELLEFVKEILVTDANENPAGRVPASAAKT